MYFKLLWKDSNQHILLRILLLGRVHLPWPQEKNDDFWTRTNIDIFEDYCNHLLNCWRYIKKYKNSETRTNIDLNEG